MIKLIKINNSTSNTPEIETLEKNSTLILKAGEAIKVETGRAVRTTAYDRPDYVTLTEAKSGETTVAAYRVSKDMVFEADYLGENDVYPGDRLPVSSAGTGFMQYVGEPEADGPAIALNRNNYGNKIMILFN